MNRLEEIHIKQEKLCALIDQHGANGLWLRRSRNVAWFTGGADPVLDITTETGAYGVLMMAKDRRRLIVTDNIESKRLVAEEKFQALGFDYLETPWYRSVGENISKMPKVLVDDGEVEGQVAVLRRVLLPPEQDRMRALGADAAAALEEVAQTIRPGDSEFEIALRLSHACHQRGGIAIVNMVAVDERITQFRHPVTTTRRMKRLAMMILCMRRAGLVVAATRMVHAGRISDDLDEKAMMVAYVDAVAVAGSQPGRTLGAVFADLQEAYAKHSQEAQWMNHHQGGLIAYDAHERIAVPNDPTPLEVGHALAWHPSITGCICEDTILLTENGVEIVTSSPNWRMVQVEVGNQMIRRPGILEV